MPVQGEWKVFRTSGGEFLTARRSFSTTLYNEKYMLIFGGSAVYSTNFYNEIWVLNCLTFVWSQLTLSGSLLVGRYAAAMLYFRDKLLISGGIKNSLHELLPTTFSVIGPLNTMYT